MSQKLDDASTSSQVSTASQILARSRTFLAELFVRMRPQLKWVARQQTQSLPNCKEDESDIVQRSVVKAFEHIDQFEGSSPGQWRAWLVKIVRNQAKDVRRYWQQERRTHKNEEHNSHLIVDLEDKNLLTPSKMLDAEEHQQIVDNALASLSIQEQQLIRWRVFQFATYKQIAERLRVTEPTARRRCDAAKLAFKEALERLGA